MGQSLSRDREEVSCELVSGRQIQSSALTTGSTELSRASARALKEARRRLCRSPLARLPSCSPARVPVARSPTRPVRTLESRWSVSLQLPSVDRLSRRSETQTKFNVIRLCRHRTAQSHRYTVRGSPSYYVHITANMEVMSQNCTNHAIGTKPSPRTTELHNRQ